MGKISQYNDVPVPKLSDMLIGTSVGLNEQDQVENQTYNFTLQQLLDLFVPNIPSNNLQGVLDNGNTATQDINLFGKITTDDLEVTNDATFNNAYFPENMYVPGLIFDETYESGTTGQVLSRTATGVKWISLPPIFTPNLQQVLNVGNIASTNIQLSATLFADAVEADDITSNTSLTVNGELVDGDGSSGLNNQVLTSTGSGKVEWKDQITYSGVAPISVDNGTKQISISQAGPTTNGYLSSTDWNAFDSKQDGLFGTGIVKSTAGVITYISDNSADWNSAYNDTIVSAGVAGTTTKTLTLTQRDGGTITASWSDIDTAPVTSVFGRTGDVVAQTGDYTTTQVTEGTNLYYLDSRARAAISITTTGSSGPATYNSSTGVLNIPDYGGGLTRYVPYTGATNNVDLGLYYLKADYLSISTTTSHTASVAEIVWNPIDGTFDMGLLNGVTLQSGQELHFYGKAVGAIPNGSPVMFAGAQGDHLLISVATPAVINANPEYFIGVATQDFANNDFGYITILGKVRGLNTTSYPEGTVLYFNSASGGFTSTMPSAPNAKIIVAAVVRSHATQGSIMVRPHTMPKIEDIQNVGISSVGTNDVLVYDTDKWENKTIPEILGYIPIGLNSLSASSPLSYNNTTGDFSIQQANGSQDGYLSSTDWNTFNSKVSSQWVTSGSDIYYSLGSVLVGTSTSLGLEKLLIQFDSNSSIYQGLNILDSYSSANGSVFAAFRKSDGTGVGSIKRNGTTDGLFIDGGINLALGVANTERVSITSSGNVGINKTNPTVALDVVGQIRSTTGFLGNASTATALASPRTFTIGNTGKSFDGTANVSWTLGEIGAQAAGNYITSLTGEATATGPGAASVTLTNSAVTGKVLTGVNITGGSINDTDSILTAFGKVQNQINGLVGGSIYQGTWNASTNTPSLASGVGTKGYYYIVSVAGSTNLDGITDWNVGDWAIFDGTAWQQVDNTDAVVSVNGFTGAVSLTTANIPEASNLYYTDARARAALSFAAGSGAYNSSTGVITIPTNTSQLTNGANFITLASLSASSPLSYNNGTGAFSITQANSTTNGFLSSTDWNTFNNKQNALTNPITGTSSSGRVAFFNGTTTQTGDSNFFWDNTNKRLGIGTISPNGKIESYISSGSEIALRLNSNFTGGNTVDFQPFISGVSNNGFSILLGGTQRMVISNGGNVGVSTTNPNTRLSVGVTWSNSTNTPFISSQVDSTTLNSIGTFVESTSTAATAMTFFTNPANGTTTERMRITSSGNVGIGTTSPNQKLHVDGNGQFAWLGRLSFDYDNVGSYSKGIKAVASGGRGLEVFCFENDSNGGIRFLTGTTASPSERVRIEGNGNVGIGTSSPTTILDLGGASNKAMTVSSATSNRAFYGAWQDVAVIGVNRNPTDGSFTDTNKSSADISLVGQSGNGFIVFGTTATNGGIPTERMRITSSGNVGINTTSASYRLDVSGNARITNGILNSDNYFERVFSSGITFPNGTSNLAANIQLPNDAFWGYIEVEVTGTFENQSTSGKLTKTFAVGTIAGGTIFVNESRVSDAMGTIANEIAIGNFAWNGTQYVIPISHITAFGNSYTVRVRMFSHSGGAKLVFDNLSIGSNYTLTALSRQYPYFNNRLGVGKSNPTSRLDVLGVNNETIASFANTSGAVGQTPGVYIQAGTNSSDYSLAVYGAFGSSHVYVRGDGNVGLGTTSPSFRLQLASDSAAKPSTNTWTISSDERIKENINPYEKGLETILAINPVTYDYNGKAGFSKIKGNIGIIAQDIKDILPESISTYKAKLNEDDEEETELLNFNSHALTYVLINAIKEQQKQIEELKNQITRLI